MRLIDADLLLENALKCNIGRKSFEEMIKCVNEQPTAYDLETVVQQLEELKNDFIENMIDGDYLRGNVNFAVNAIEIVKRKMNNEKSD